MSEKIVLDKAPMSLTEIEKKFDNVCDMSHKIRIADSKVNEMTTEHMENMTQLVRKRDEARNAVLKEIYYFIKYEIWYATDRIINDDQAICIWRKVELKYNNIAFWDEIVFDLWDSIQLIISFILAENKTKE